MISVSGWGNESGLCVVLRRASLPLSMGVGGPDYEQF